METSLDVLSRAASYVERVNEIQVEDDSVVTMSSVLKDKEIVLHSTTTTTMKRQSSSSPSDDGDVLATDSNSNTASGVEKTLDSEFYPLKKRPRNSSPIPPTSEPGNEEKKVDENEERCSKNDSSKTFRFLDSSNSSHRDSSSTRLDSSQDLPLNLTTSTTFSSSVISSDTSGNSNSNSNSASTALTYTQLRPSVIIRAVDTLLADDIPVAYGLNSPAATSSSSTHHLHNLGLPPVPVPNLYNTITSIGGSTQGRVGRKVLTTAVDDSLLSVDEHFRRSLGNNYPDLPLQSGMVITPQQQGHVGGLVVHHQPQQQQQQQQPSISPIDLTPSNVNDDDSVDGSVDDHFARSLGQSKWNEIKSKSSSPGPNSSVDEHFAKALGEQWASMKAQHQEENNQPRLVSEGTNAENKRLYCHR